MIKNELTAVYFPGEIDYLRKDYGTSQLKKTLVYFDQIKTLVPESVFNGFDYMPHSFSRSQRIETFLKETTSLRELGILSCVKPGENIFSKNTHLTGLPDAELVFEDIEQINAYLPEILFRSIVSDIEDEKFRSMVEQFNLDSIPVFTEQLQINWFSMLSDEGHQRDLWEHPKSDSVDKGFSAIVSPQLGAAVLLNHAIITSIKYNAIPVANNKYFDSLLRHKFERIENTPKVSQILERIRKKQDWNRDLLASSVLNLYLPDFNLHSFDDVLELRDKAKDELDAFRFYMNTLTSELRIVPISQIPDLIKQITSSKIEPALFDLRKKIHLSNDKFILRVVKGLKSAEATIPLIGTVFVGLPVWLGIALSAGATIGEAIIETLSEKREIRENNGLSFLLRFQ